MNVTVVDTIIGTDGTIIINMSAYKVADFAMNGTVNVTVNGRNLTIIIDEDGFGSIDVGSDFAAGNYSITAVYFDNIDYYEVTSTDAELKVEQATPSMEVTFTNITIGENATFTINLTGIEGFVIDGEVSFNIAGNEYIVNLTDGVATIDLGYNITAGVYDGIVFSYAGN